MTRVGALEFLRTSGVKECIPVLVLQPNQCPISLPLAMQEDNPTIRNGVDESPPPPP